jgi:single-stranded DNA-binding protein
MNAATLTGTIAGRVNARRNKGGMDITEFWLQVDGSRHKDVLRIVAFKEMAQRAAKSLRPGMRVAVFGRISRSVHELTDEYSIVLSDFCADGTAGKAAAFELI